MRLVSSLHRARGLGTSKSGVDHWWWERITSLVLIPLGLWFLISLIRIAPGGLETVLPWFTSPLNAVGSVILLATLFYHTSLGIQVVIEDYVHVEWKKLGGIILSRFLFLVLALIGIFSIVRLHFGAL